MATDRPAAATAILAVLLVAACGSDGSRRTHRIKGADLYAEGRVRSAIAELELALAEEPDDFRLHYDRALAYHDLMREAAAAGDDDEAERARRLAEAGYQRVLELSPGNARALSSLAILRRDQGDLAGAIAILESGAAAGEEGRVLPLWTLGTLQRDAGRSEAAAASFAAALEENPEHVPSAVALARLHRESGAIAAAEAVIEAGLAHAPYDYTLRSEAARAALDRARAGAPSEDETAWRDAEHRLELVLQLSAGDWWVFDALAEVRERLGDAEGAVRALWRARELASETVLERAGVDPAAWRAEVDRRLDALYARLARREDRGP